MIARIWPLGTEILTRLTAVRPPKRIVRFSVRRTADTAAPRPLPAGAPLPGWRGGATPLRELARGREHRLLFRHRLQDVMLVVLDLEDELAQERLVVLPAERLVALRKVVGLLHLEAFERLDELRGVLATAEARLLHTELEEIDGLEVGLHVAIRQRSRRVDLLEPRDRVVEEALVGGGVERRLHHRHVAVDADEA